MSAAQSGAAAPSPRLGIWTTWRNAHATIVYEQHTGLLFGVEAQPLFVSAAEFWRMMQEQRLNHRLSGEPFTIQQLVEWVP